MIFFFYRNFAHEIWLINQWGKSLTFPARPPVAWRGGRVRKKRINGNATDGTAEHGGHSAAHGSTATGHGHDRNMLQGPAMAELVSSRSQFGLWLLRYLSFLRLDLQQWTASSTLHSPPRPLSPLVSKTHLPNFWKCSSDFAFSSEF